MPTEVDHPREIACELDPASAPPLPSEPRPARSFEIREDREQAQEFLGMILEYGGIRSHDRDEDGLRPEIQNVRHRGFEVGQHLSGFSRKPGIDQHTMSATLQENRLAFTDVQRNKPKPSRMVCTQTTCVDCNYYVER